MVPIMALDVGDLLFIATIYVMLILNGQCAQVAQGHC